MIAFFVKFMVVSMGIVSLGVSGGIREMMEFHISPCYKALKKSGKLSDVGHFKLRKRISEMVPYIFPQNRACFYDALVECIDRVTKESLLQPPSYNLLTAIGKEVRSKLGKFLKPSYFFDIEEDFNTIFSEKSSKKNFIDMTLKLMERYTEPYLQTRLEKEIFKNLANHREFVKLRPTINTIFDSSKRSIIVKQFLVHNVYVPLSREEQIVFIPSLGGNVRVRLIFQEQDKRHASF
ncbi:hypothetical protein [Holospora curviuscula]|uniref:Uncharacterized protein n=1 Tax=Holospora curviuscula TaxID=1082868 RepID=A0A2S5R7K7_9PROT|nr:hypothetical protein [Holospora curviuscula]PPE03105.1 hypothetical protein HCUR_01455 [Holospora curviuscula]